MIALRGTVIRPLVEAIGGTRILKTGAEYAISTGQTMRMNLAVWIQGVQKELDESCAREQVLERKLPQLREG